MQRLLPGTSHRLCHSGVTIHFDTGTFHPASTLTDLEMIGGKENE
jgi:hypothetical protein